MLRAFGRNGSIWCYEPGAAIDFKPTLYVRLTREQVENKIKLISFYKSQDKKIYAQKSLTWSKARYWGSKCGSDYAEAFHIVRYRI